MWPTIRNQAVFKGLWRPLRNDFNQLLSNSGSHSSRISSHPSWRRRTWDKVVPYLPRVLQPETWSKVFPSRLTHLSRDMLFEPEKKQNPATFFIWIYILIGSQAIRILQVKDEYTVYSRKAETQIAKLREVVEKLQAGEEVDVEKVLGTGIASEEDAWEEALREIEREEALWAQNRDREREKRELAEKVELENEKSRTDASPVNAAEALHGSSASSSSRPVIAAPGFF